MSLIGKFFNQYLRRSKTAWESEKVLLHRSDVFSVMASETAFDFTVSMSVMVRAYCLAEGIEIDRVSICLSYDADLDPAESFSANSNTFLRVVERDNGKVEAIVFLGSYFENR